MYALHIFNLSNDLALAADSPSYTPPKAIADMERSMADFPKRWAQPGDVVLTDWRTTYEQLVRAAGHELIPRPWGWSRALRNRLLRMGVPESLLPTTEEIAVWRTLSSRRFAALHISRLLPLLPSNYRWAGQAMRFHESGAHIRLPAGPWVVKPEYSSSGRGLQMIEGPFALEGPCLTDIHYERVLDCALLFHVSDDHHLSFRGVSVFRTNDRGGYLRQERQPQPRLRTLILEAASLTNTQLDTLIDAHLTLLTESLAPHYRGWLGVDMLAGRDSYGRPILHPCLEINLRMTMGVAWLLEEARQSSAAVLNE